MIRRALAAAPQTFTVIFTVSLSGTSIGAGFQAIVKKDTFRDLSTSIDSHHGRGQHHPHHRHASVWVRETPKEGPPTRSPESFVADAENFYNEGKLSQSIDAYQQAILADPNNPSLYVTLAGVQVFAGEYQEAITNTQNALLKNPNNPMAHAVQGWAQSLNGDHLAAEAAIKKSLEVEKADQRPGWNGAPA